VRQDPVLSRTKLIAEPWDLGPGGYQVGRFPPGWAEWNDRYRDTVRAFWRGDEGRLPELAARITASADLFSKRGRRPWASINFITVHDGFTLHDLVSCNHKHNEANGEDNRDGHDNNLSANYGVEGPTDDPSILEVRWRQMRNMLATLLFSQGTPMLLAGDEFGRTQHGNNNAYAQDSEIGWVGWESLSDGGRSLCDFTRRLLALRASKSVLRRRRFLTGAYNEELDVKDVTWLTPTGEEMTPEQWNDAHARALGVLLDGRAQPTGIRRRGRDLTMLLILNAHEGVVTFKLNAVVGGSCWMLLVDTNHPELEDAVPLAFGSDYDVPGRSLLLLEARRIAANP
jgi:isoamylase